MGPCLSTPKTLQQKADVGPAAAASSRACSREPSRESNMMYKARLLLAELMALKGPDAASQASEVILKHLKVGNVSIIACTSRPDLFLRLSGHGMFPARSYHRTTVLLGSDSCAAGLFRAAGQDGGVPPAVLYRTATTADEAANILPKDWEEQYHYSGMRTFLAVPIMAHSSEPMLGVLTLSSFQPGAFWESSWEPMLGIVAAGLVPLMQERLTQGLVELAMHVLSTASIMDFVTAVLQQTSLLLDSIYNRPTSVRLGLLSPDQQSVLLMLPPQQLAKSRECSSGMTISCGSLADDLRLLQLPISHTLLHEALSSGQPCVVHNTTKLLEGDSKQPCKDVFVDADGVVGSIVAAPLLTTCLAHTKGCSCFVSQGRGIADVGYVGTSSRTTISSISTTSSSSNVSSAGSTVGDSAAGGAAGSGSHRSRHATTQQQPHRSRKPSPQVAQQQQQQQQQQVAAAEQHSQARWYGCLYIACTSPYRYEAELPAIVALSKMLTVLMLQCMPASMAWRELTEMRLAKQSSSRHISSSTNNSSSTVHVSGSSKASSNGSPHTPAAAGDGRCGGGAEHRHHHHHHHHHHRVSGSPAAAGGGFGGSVPPSGAGLFVQVRRSSSLDAVPNNPALTPTGSMSPISAASAPLAAAAASDRSMATSSIVETLRRQVQRTRDRCARPDAEYVQELQLQHLIGKGGYGTVYSGTFQGSPVAVKVMYVSQHERQLLKSAMEMAVLASMQHPNIVRVYACLTDLVEEAGPMRDGSCNPLLSVRYRPLQDSDVGKNRPSTLCNIVVMERCDKGNLHQAMRHGLLHKRLPNKGLVVDMRLLNTVLLQVAHSLQHLHEHDIIHSDVKCENCLLSSSNSSPIGFVVKLGDFGLVRLLLGGPYIRNRSGSGTTAYQAPEVFLEASRLTTAVDVFSFGILMWELYCCRRPYSGQAKDTIARRVYRQQQRPEFPAGTWTNYQRLAERCWATDPEQRPRFDEIIRELQQLLDAAGGPFTISSPLVVAEEEEEEDDCCRGGRGSGGGGGVGGRVGAR